MLVLSTVLFSTALIRIACYRTERQLVLIFFHVRSRLVCLFFFFGWVLMYLLLANVSADYGFYFFFFFKCFSEARWLRTTVLRFSWHRPQPAGCWCSGRMPSWTCNLETHLLAELCSWVCVAGFGLFFFKFCLFLIITDQCCAFC